MSHVTHMNESFHTYEWVMSHIWMSHVTHMNESWHTYEWVMSHIWMSHGAHLNELCHTYEWVMSHIRMSHVTHTNASCRNTHIHSTPTWNTQYTYLRYTAHSRETSSTQHSCSRHTTITWITQYTHVSYTALLREIHIHSTPTWNTQSTYLRYTVQLREIHSTIARNVKHTAQLLETHNTITWNIRLSAYVCVKECASETHNTLESPSLPFAYEWIMACICMESCRACALVTSHIWMGPAVHMNKSWLVYVKHTTHLYISLSLSNSMSHCVVFWTIVLYASRN